MFYFHETVYLLKRSYKKIVADLLDRTEKITEVPGQVPVRRDKKLILDMDWHRWGLKEHEIREHLYRHDFLSEYADFVRIKREEVFNKEEQYEGVTGDNYKNISFDGFNLWGICKTSIAVSLGEISPDPKNAGHMKKISLIYGSARNGISEVKRILEEYVPDSVFVCQGGIYDSRCIIEVARRENINVVCIENSMISDHVLLDNLSGQIVNRHSLARLGTELLEVRAVTENERRESYDFWESRLSDKKQEHRTGGVDDESELRNLLGLDKNKKVLLLLGQVRTDASVLLDSNIYPDPVDMISDVAAWAKERKNIILVVRLHPKEFKGKSPLGIPYNRMTARKLAERGLFDIPNVRIVEDTSINTYSLMNIAHAGITITSQAGLEMLMLGKPVMVCGNAFYGGKGFTVDLGHVSALRSELDHLTDKEVLDADQKRKALDFFHLFHEWLIFNRELSGKNDQLARIFRLDHCSLEDPRV